MCPFFCVDLAKIGPLLSVRICCMCAHAVQALFKRITSLSYLGDVRMGLAEDSRKVERIVAGSYSHFMDAYLPVLQVRLARLHGNE